VKNKAFSKGDFNYTLYFVLGSSSTQCGANNNSLNNKYCGFYLGYATSAMANQPICGTAHVFFN
jgi:hypothetical protein